MTAPRSLCSLKLSLFLWVLQWSLMYVFFLQALATCYSHGVSTSWLSRFLTVFQHSMKSQPTYSSSQTRLSLCLNIFAACLAAREEGDLSSVTVSFHGLSLTSELSVYFQWIHHLGHYKYYGWKPVNLKYSGFLKTEYFAVDIGLTHSRVTRYGSWFPSQWPSLCFIYPLHLFC